VNWKRIIGLDNLAEECRFARSESTGYKSLPNRKNALFYKTLNGAGVADLFMSLIHTCELNGANPFHYLTELQWRAEELKQNPSEWMT
jgi:hypothetical protein